MRKSQRFLAKALCFSPALQVDLSQTHLSGWYGGCWVEPPRAAPGIESGPLIESNLVIWQVSIRLDERLDIGGANPGGT